MGPASGNIRYSAALSGPARTPQHPHAGRTSLANGGQLVRVRRRRRNRVGQQVVDRRRRLGRVGLRVVEPVQEPARVDGVVQKDEARDGAHRRLAAQRQSRGWELGSVEPDGRQGGRSGFMLDVASSKIAPTPHP